MKTLDDALKTPGVIEPDVYSIGANDCFFEAKDGLIMISGYDLTPEILRRIADHLDPPATEEPRGCPMPGACACSTATLHIDRIKAEARREALEEIAAFMGAQRNTVPMTGEEAAAAIRALIEKGPTDGKSS